MGTPQQEKARLKALYSFHILDTEEEKHFDQLLKLVAKRFAVPMCFINLVDEDRFWFKATFGAPVKELCRSSGFCETTLERKHFYEIPNALEEPTVSHTDWVQGEVQVRYYAGAPLLTNDNLAIGTLCMFDTKARKFDINDIDDLEAFAIMTMQLIELNKLKEEQLRTKNMESVGRITGGVAHDFNNQLSGITSSIDLLELQPDISEKSNDLIKSIRQCAQRSSDLVGKLLNLSHHRNYDKKLFNLHELLNDLYSLMTRILDPSIEIKLDLKASRPICLGDRNQLHSSLLNILINAKDAMPNGGTIEIISQDSPENPIAPENLPAGSYALVQIKDNGSGIPLDKVNKVFEPFYTTKKPDKGTGLGLPSALEVVRHHNGTILIETSDKGSTFNIYLPKSSDSELTEIPHKEMSVLHKGPKRVLLAEDEELLRKLYRLLLEELGFKVKTCQDGKEALDYLSKDQGFDVLITDIRMPQLDGFQLYREIRKFMPNLQVIMISGFADQERVRALSEQGNVCYLQKPFTDSELSEVLETCLSNHPMK